MSRVTELASGQINGCDTITIELIEADGTPAVIIVRWPARPTVLKRGRVIIYSPACPHCGHSAHMRNETVRHQTKRAALLIRNAVLSRAETRRS